MHQPFTNYPSINLHQLIFHTTLIHWTPNPPPNPPLNPPLNPPPNPPPAAPYQLHLFLPTPPTNHYSLSSFNNSHSSPSSHPQLTHRYSNPFHHGTFLHPLTHNPLQGTIFTWKKNRRKKTMETTTWWWAG